MKLHTQLIILSLLTLSLPWAGCEYIREMENTLRDGQAQNLLTTTKTIAHVLSYEDSTVFHHEKLTSNRNLAENNIYAYTLDSRIILDGYSDDWGGYHDNVRYFPNQLEVSSQDRTGFMAAGNSNYIYLFVSVKDNRPIYHDPALGLINGDRLQILLEQKDGQPRTYTLQTSAPGKVSARYIVAADSLNPRPRREARIHGQWQDTADGFNIEIRIPRKLIHGHINFAIVDIDDRQQTRGGWYGTWNQINNLNNGLIIEQSPALQDIVKRFKQDNARIRIIDTQGWLLTSIGSPGRRDTGTNTLELNETLMAILNQLYHFIMYFSERSSPAIQFHQGRLTGDLVEQALGEQADTQPGGTAWYKPERSNRAIVTATYPVKANGEVIGIVVADQSSDAILTLTNYALNRLITLSSIAILLSAAGLLGYATYLSIRIRKLRDATENMISPDGIIGDSFTPSRANDELGDLSRSFASMHKRLTEYTQYLRTLASKLSHELHTPLAVVQSSLDNLAAESDKQKINLYTQRARDGSERLGKIISAMSEASRVEQSIQGSDMNAFDIVPVVKSGIDAYRDVYPQRQFHAKGFEGRCVIHGNPELLVQMLDKLVDNAVDFSPENSDINIELIKADGNLELRINNTGSQLPDNMQAQLFDSMVSVRDNQSAKTHMGLGLYIVKLIAEAHGGRVTARNTEDGQGVDFIVTLPCLD